MCYECVTSPPDPFLSCTTRNGFSPDAESIQEKTWKAPWALQVLSTPSQPSGSLAVAAPSMVPSHVSQATASSLSDPRVARICPHCPSVDICLMVLLTILLWGVVIWHPSQGLGRLLEQYFSESIVTYCTAPCLLIRLAVSWWNWVPLEHLKFKLKTFMFAGAFK